MNSLTRIGAVSAFAALTDAKTFTNVEEGRKTHHEVEAFSIKDDLCFFKNSNDSWCLAATPPMIKVGVENIQKFTTTPSNDPPVLKYYNYEWHAYS
jgi:hypothetical protein